MQIKISKAAVISLVILSLMTACTEKAAEMQPQAATPATELAAENMPVSKPKPLSMRVIDVRLKTGMGQNKSCNIESANGTPFGPEQPRASRAKTIDIAGWIIDEQTKTVPGNVKLRLQTANGVSAWEQDITRWLNRSDVAKNYGEDAYLKSGFKVSLDIADLAPGDYVVYLAFGGSAGNAICGIGRRLTLTP